jgi:predicted hotdog family 3-hydroxylacyl-ACP dehydratase
MNAPVDIRELIPHAGAMCLLERVVWWNEGGAILATTSHRRHDNPLQLRGRLSAICLCEYGAQAAAVHGGLVARAAGRRMVPGFLAALREVVVTTEPVDALPGEITVEVERLHAGGTGFQYVFRVTHDGAELARGRAAIIEIPGAA